MSTVHRVTSSTPASAQPIQFTDYQNRTSANRLGAPTSFNRYKGVGRRRRIKMNNGFLIGLAIIVALANAQKFAFVSLLSSNEYLTTAKVLGHKLKLLNDSVPYVIIVTEDITTKTRSSLQSQGIKLREFPKIDTPYLSTHKARKFQYTKIRPWSMTEYDVIVHLDLDLLPVEDITPLFYCGTFCAVFRHSDMFNSGVYVLKPNNSVFEDMKSKIHTLVSYDGGDQGYLNSYFPDLKYAPMFDETNITHQRYSSSFMRLAAGYNFDIGMYYLNGGKLPVSPKIVHYTMGPVKPWLWWTYPLFDINYLWLETRFEMEEALNLPSQNMELILLELVTLTITIFAKQLVELVLRERLRNENANRNEKTKVSHFIVLFSLFVSWKLVPTAPHPVPCWIFFGSNTILMSLLLASMYSWLRLGVRTTLKRHLVVITVLTSSAVCSWLLVANVSSFGNRSIAAILGEKATNACPPILVQQTVPSRHRKKRQLDPCLVLAKGSINLIKDWQFVQDRQKGYTFEFVSLSTSSSPEEVDGRSGAIIVGGALLIAKRRFHRRGPWLHLSFLPSTMHKPDEECSYCSLTIIALCIAFSSAILTFFVASYMYTGVNEKIEIPSALKSFGSNRLVVPHKKVIIVKLDLQNRCYIMPAYLARKMTSAKFTIVDEPLNPEFLQEIAGDDGVDFCSGTPAYILEKPLL
ncbi:unnamed protein product [Caenorhabditis auriculariae]|uniref:Uncharacterized protein n=1 Tax=Caenorhabditis auriculariae TaxID=2777116 RepID=A0A8S1H0R0_9PELO|nr:unnamed protein product [Caenorhabditis auriculariae]